VLHDAGRFESAQRLVTLSAGTLASVVACARPLEDRSSLVELALARRGGGNDLAQSRPVWLGRPLQRIDQRQRLLVLGQVRGFLARRLLVAPDAEQVVVDLERDTERPAKAAVGVDDVRIVARQQGSGLDGGRDQRRSLAADHVEVEVDRQHLIVLGAPDVHELAFTQREARLVVEAHQGQHLGVGEPELAQPVERHARQGEQGVAGVDRLRDAPHRPKGRPVASLDVAILDVVVDETEVVAELDRGCAGQGRPVVAGDRLVGEQSEQRTQPLAARRLGVEPEVVADHVVQLGRALVLRLLDNAQDLRLRVGDQRIQVRRRQHGGRIQASAVISDTW
jgi:hypothetical protein